MRAVHLALVTAVALVVGCERRDRPISGDPPAPSSVSTVASAAPVASTEPSAAPSVSSAKPASARMREGSVTVKGRLPPEVVQRVVRQHFARLRSCYESAARTNPSLEGRVSVHFVIGAKGRVESVGDGGSDLPDKGVVDCALAEFRTFSFPAPQGGTVDVTYPIVFGPGPEPAPNGLAGVDDADGGIGLGNFGGRGHCPCGCDHSVAMVDVLRGEPGPDALRAIDESLRTIGDREDAGFITERMVAHRLRLLGLAAELGRPGPVRFTPTPSIHATLSGRTSTGATVRMEPILHGESTEIVNGEEKTTPASFVLRMELENGGAASITLRAPTLGAAPALPVSRWYVVGGDGRPWDGVLGPGEKKLVYAIGYAAAPVRAGANVRVTVQLESLSVATTVRARARWNEGG